jgi:hypothetical protein
VEVVGSTENSFAANLNGTDPRWRVNASLGSGNPELSTFRTVDDGERFRVSLRLIFCYSRLLEKLRIPDENV